MRGGSVTQQAMELPIDYTGTPMVSGNDTISVIDPNGEAVVADNMKYAVTPGSLVWVLALTVLYAFWGWWDNRKIGESFSVGDIKVNLSNFVKVTLGVVIAINLMQVFLAKLAAMKIPFLSRFAGTLLPLFSF